MGADQTVPFYLIFCYHNIVSLRTNYEVFMKKLEIEKIRELHHSINRNIDMVNKRPKQIKNFTQIRIMFYLLNNEDKTIYQKDIGENLKLKKSSITEHLDYLESVGVIERVADKKDKRKNSIRLSMAAKEKKKEIDDSLININNKMIDGISKSELEMFNNVLAKMEENIKRI